MKTWLAITLLAFLGTSVAAGDKGTLSMVQYLDQVKQQNPQARAALESMYSFQLRDSEAESPILTNLYAQWNRRDDKKPTAVPLFMGTETLTEGWRAGLQKQTEYGLGMDLYFNSQRTIINGAGPQFIPVNNFNESSANLELSQSLWRNAFGEGTRAQIEADRATNDANMLQSKFDLKNIMLNAENAYLAVVSLNQIVKLQTENVERAKRLRDYMQNRAKLKLVDDTDFMQTEASYLSRGLELQSSINARASMIRAFNTLRGVDNDEIPNLDTWPDQAMMKETEKAPTGRMTREDFQMMRAQAKAAQAKAKFANSQIQPKLDLNAGISTNGRDGVTPNAIYQAETDHYPTWFVGASFSIPIDFRLISDVRHGYRKAAEAAEDMQAQANFSETRAWDDLVNQKKEAQVQYEQAVRVEELQTQLTKREQVRLHNGRTTTFEALQLEQNLALAQVQRVQNQLNLLKVHNAIQMFEAQK